MTPQEQFNNIDRMPIIEINLSDFIGGEDDYIVFNISASDEGLHADSIFIEWDETFSLDEHIQKLYELIAEDVLNA